MKSNWQESGAKLSRRLMLAGLAAPALAACAARPSEQAAHSPQGLDAVIDISNNVQVSDFRAVRRSNILAVIHKATEGGDWVDPAYAQRRSQAVSAGLLWGAYHFGTRQYSGADQAAAFLSTCQPGPGTLLALDLEPNDPKPKNSMTMAQAEAFVVAVQRATGRWPLLYTHASYADGQRYGRRNISLGQPITASSPLSKCDLWLADYRDEPTLPSAWAGRGWRLWQYAGDHSAADAAYGTPGRIVHGLTHCDRNLFAGNEVALYKYWKAT